ncbi:MAG: cobalamin biosynthesis protein CobD [Methanomicrobium sp.]|nr:cobalamin biosynthesis protein CobD [Methanomicrobium sp.]
MAPAALILLLSLVIDRLTGDPQSRFHPVALLGSLIAVWGRPEIYPVRIQRLAGAVFALATACIFTLPFLLVERCLPLLTSADLTPALPSLPAILSTVIIVIISAFLLKVCFAWRCLEEHVENVESALKSGGEGSGREAVQRLVSRDAATLKDEEILSGAFESMAENLVDSIISPLFFFTLFGLAGAAFYRAANTMDAMLGYKDERIRLGWFAARMDDVLNYIPARFSGLVLILYFAARGKFRPAWKTFIADRKKREGFNGGIPMSLIAGGCETAFVKPGVYVIGGEGKKRSLSEAKKDIFAAVRWASVISALIFCAAMTAAGGVLIGLLGI